MLKSKDKTPKKEDEAPAKVVEKKAEAAPKKEEPAAKGKDPSGSREVVEIHPTRNKAVVKIGEKKYKVIRHIKRQTGAAYLAIPHGKSVLEADWLAGKADIGIKD